MDGDESREQESLDDSAVAVTRTGDASGSVKGQRGPDDRALQQLRSDFRHTNLHVLIVITQTFRGPRASSFASISPHVDRGHDSTTMRLQRSLL